MSNPTTVPALNMKALLKVMARQTLGRVPVIGFVSRKAWGGARKLKHRARHGNPHDYAALAAVEAVAAARAAEAEAVAAARAVQSAHATQVAQYERAFQELHALLAEKFRDVVHISQNTHALITEVRDGAFDRLDNGLREQWKVKDVILAAFAETGGIVADTNRGVQAGLASQVNQFQQAQAEQRGVLVEGLKRLTETVGNFDGQILQLHDHHASCYLRLADAAEDTAASVRQLTTDAGLAEHVHANAQWLEKLTAATASNAQWLEQVAGGVQGNSQWLEQLTASNRGNAQWLERLSDDLRNHGLAEHVHANAQWLEKLTATTAGNAQWLEQLTETNRGNAHWLERLSDDLRGHSQWLEKLATGNHDNAQRLGMLADAQGGTTQWLESIATTLKGNGEWLDLLSRKVMMAAMDIRERIPALPEGGEYSAPVVPNSDALEERKWQSNGAIRLNLGCGEKPLPDYINCDGRALADVLVIADVRALPFADGTVDEIASAHLVEHFRQHHLETVILPYWKKLLKPGGTLRVICPNWESMIQRLNRGEMSMADFKHVTFGGQDYQGDDHFSMYTPQSLGELLERAGFRSPTVIVADRMNGLCPEMEVTATAG